MTSKIISLFVFVALAVNVQCQTTRQTTPATTPRRAGGTVTTPARFAPPTSGVFVETNDTAIETLKTVFDCRRTGHDCYELGGTCDLETGLCMCNDNYTGFACDIQLDTLAISTFCNNGTGCGDDPEAFCLGHNNGKDYSCSCPYSLYGSTCEKPRYELRCSGSFMAINVLPYSMRGFQGQLFVIDVSNSTQIDARTCGFSNFIGNGPATLRVPYSDVVSKCGGRSLDNNKRRAPGDMLQTQEITFIVQSDVEWLTPFDQVITARCSLNVSQQFQKTIIVNAGSNAGLEGPRGVPLSAQSQFGVAHVSNDLANVLSSEMKAERKKVEFLTIVPKPIISLLQEKTAEDGSVGVVPINNLVRIGDVVAVKIENVNDTFFSAIRPEDCTLKMDESMTANLISNHCPASRLALTLLLWSKTEVTSTWVQFYLRLPANALAGQPRQITIGCRVKLCADDMINECAMSEEDCKSTTSRFLAASSWSVRTNRKRRSPDSTAYAYVKKTFEVDYGNSATRFYLSSLSLVVLMAAKWFL